MLFDKINPALFRPLASPNAPVYGIALLALYERMVVNEIDSMECTPGECRNAISLKLIEHNQHVDWQQEADDVAKADHEEYDEAAQIYRYLKKCGWIEEMEDIGYKRFAYMPRLAANILSALDSISSDKPSNVGATCEGVFVTLTKAIESPGEHATAIGFASQIAVDYCRDLSNISASSREIAHQLMKENGTAKILATYFNQFVKGILLIDYSKMKTTNHPYRFRAQTMHLVVEIKNNTELMDQLVMGLIKSETDGGAPIELRNKILQQLDDIYNSFDLIARLMERIDHYRRVMTQRSKEAMQYAMTAIPDLGQRVDNLIAMLNEQVPEVRECPAYFANDTGISASRQYTPRVKRPEAQSTTLEIQPPPLKELAKLRAMDEFYQRRIENPDRIIDLLERSLGRQQRITTDDIRIETLDDFLGYLQLRDLAHDAVPISSSYRRLLKYYKVVSMGDELTENDYLIAPRLRIERRGPAPS